ncbi:MAG: serine/threonine-protein kinase [Candidatus Omnitrophota bacterium]
MVKWQVGDKIDNRYEIHQILGGEGKSGMGVVYICYDRDDNSIYALKSLQEQYFFSERAQKFFENEALVWINLEKHPYIVRSHSIRRTKGKLYIVLEYIPPDHQGRNTLTHYLGSLTFPEILKFSIQFCHGMEYAYSKGIDAHRDIKPDNIMITPDKTVKITDFGLAKAFQEIQLKEEAISTEQNPFLSIFQSKGKQICGTLPYMAPEQFDGFADKRSDIYAFGITLYQMVTGGKLPFVGRTIQEWERLHKQGKITAVTSILFPLIQKCVEKEQDRRCQDFGYIKNELHDLLFENTGEKLIAPNPEKLETWELSNKGLAFHNLGKFELSISCYDKTLEINQENATAWMNKGNALTSLSKYQEAIACYDKAIEINPNDASIWYNKGYVLDDLDRYDEALLCYDKAIEIDPTLVLAWIGKGIILRKFGKYEEALICYNKAIAIDSKLSLTWHNRAAVLYYLDRNMEALECVEEALRLTPDFYLAHRLKQLILGKFGWSYF